MHCLPSTGKGLGAVMGVVLGAALSVSPAMAASITFNFTGTVTDVGSAIDGGTPPTFSVGQTMTGSYTFDSTTTDGIGGSQTGHYTDTISNLNVTIGSYNATLGAPLPVVPNFIEVNDKNNLDSYEAKVLFAGADQEGRFPQYFQLLLEDSTATAFSSDALPLTAPSLGDFDSKIFRLVFNGDRGTGTVLGNLTTLTAVPLPPAVILFGAGLVALIGLGAGNWRQKHNRLA